MDYIGMSEVAKVALARAETTRPAMVTTCNSSRRIPPVQLVMLHRSEPSIAGRRVLADRKDNIIDGGDWGTNLNRRRDHFHTSQ